MDLPFLPDANLFPLNTERSIITVPYEQIAPPVAQLVFKTSLLVNTVLEIFNKILPFSALIPAPA